MNLKKDLNPAFVLKEKKEISNSFLSSFHPKVNKIKLNISNNLSYFLSLIIKKPESMYQKVLLSFPENLKKRPLPLQTTNG